METVRPSSSTPEKPRHGYSHDDLQKAYEEFHARKAEAAPEKPEVVSGEVLSDEENAAYEERMAAEQTAREAEARSDLDEVLSDAEPGPEKAVDEEEKPKSPEALLEEAKELALKYINDELLPHARANYPDGKTLPQLLEAVEQINKGNLYAPFNFEYTKKTAGGEKKATDSSDSVFKVFDTIVNMWAAEKSSYSDAEKAMARRAQPALEAMRLAYEAQEEPAVPEPDKPDVPDGEPDYKAQAAEAARTSAEAYEKSPSRDRARRLEFWRHYNELKIEQMAERHRVEAEDAKRDEAEARSMNDEINEKRTLANILEDIDNADRIRDARTRETELANLALKHSGVSYPGIVDDLGVEAAKRISKSKVPALLAHVTGKKRHSDHYLERLALETGNLEAAKSMSRGKYYRPKSRFTSSKGRNAVMSEMIDKALQDGDPYAAEDIIKNHIHGLGKSEASVNARERVASRYDYPEAVMSISGLRNILKKEKAMAKVALELGKKNKTKARALAKTINFQRNLRNDTLVKISKIREDTII